MKQRIELVWRGNVSWAAGEQGENRWLLAGGGNPGAGQGIITTSVSNPTSHDQLFKIDIGGLEYCALGVYAKKTAHTEAMTFDVRKIIAYASVSFRTLPKFSLPGSGWFPPYIHIVSSSSTNDMSWNAQTGGIVDSQVLNDEGGGNAMFYSVVNTNPVLKPLRVLTCALQFDAAATPVLTGTNTWSYEVRLVGY